ncbi:MAG: SDR family oxidoreductase [Acidimicrobiales bacterium]
MSARRTVHSGDVALAVTEWGDATGPTVVLVHGFPDTSAVWTRVAESLASDHHVVAYDVRGVGGSTAPAQRRSGFRLDRLVGDLDAVITEISPDRPVHLVGHDWGSVQLWEAVTEPRLQPRIASFTSISGPCLDHVAHQLRDLLRQPRPANLVRLADQGLRSSYVFAAQLPGAPWIAGALGPTLLPLLEAAEGVDRTGTPRPTSGEVRNGLQLYRSNVRERLRSPRERTTDIPVQIIAIEGDRFVPPPMTDGVERYAPRLWRRRVQGRHWSIATHPQRAAGWIREMVAHVEGEPESRSLRRARAGATRSRFDDALVVITGTGSGFGRATALKLAARGAMVIGADIDETSARATADACRAFGVSAEARRVDVSDVDELELFAKAVLTDHGVPDIVINNAGIALAGSMLDMTADDWDRILGVNLLGVIHGCRLFGKAMVERGEGGHIVNVASAAAFGPTPTITAYGTTKAAVLQLSRSMRAELAPHGVGVTAICPGFSSTNIGRSAQYIGSRRVDAERLKRLGDRALRLRNMPPEHVADAIINAVERNRAVVATGTDARAVRLLNRLSPAAADGLGAAIGRAQHAFTFGRPAT